MLVEFTQLCIRNAFSSMKIYPCVTASQVGSIHHEKHPKTCIKVSRKLLTRFLFSHLTFLLTSSFAGFTGAMTWNFNDQEAPKVVKMLSA